MKEEKNKVGRPKLADTNLKKNSIIMILVAIIGLISLIIGGIFTLTNVNIRNLKGQVSKNDYKFKLVDIYGKKEMNRKGLGYHCELNAVVGNVGKNVVFIKDSSNGWYFWYDQNSERIESSYSKEYDNGGNYSVYLSSYYDDYTDDNFNYKNDVYTAKYTFTVDKKCNVSNIKFRSESYSPIANYKPGWNKKVHKSYYNQTDYCYMNKNGKTYLSQGKYKLKYKNKKNTYEFYNDGCIVIGVKGNKYQTLKDGIITNKLLTLQGNKYYLKKNGEVARNEFIKINNKWYYFNKDAEMLKNTSITISGNRYQFNANGVCTYGSKCGITTTTKKTTTKKILELNCPKTVKVNKVFTCTTNMSGVKFTVSSAGLASGYSTTFTTTNSDRTKQSKYTTEGTKTITVSKSGYTSVTRQVKVKYKLQGGNGGHYVK